MRIYVANLGSEIKDADLQEAFAAYGDVTSVSVATDKYSGESRGFGFVEMPKQDQGNAAIAGLNGQQLKGRTLRVEEARPRDASRTGGGGGGRGGYGDGGGGGRGGYGGGGGGGGRSGGGGGGRRSW